MTEPALEPSWSEPAIAEPPPTASLAADIYSPQPSAAEPFVSDPIDEESAAAESFAAVVAPLQAFFRLEAASEEQCRRLEY